MFVNVLQILSPVLEKLPANSVMKQIILVNVRKVLNHVKVILLEHFVTQHIMSANVHQHLNPVMENLLAITVMQQTTFVNVLQLSTHVLENTRDNIVILKLIMEEANVNAQKTLNVMLLVNCASMVNVSADRLILVPQNRQESIVMQH